MTHLLKPGLHERNKHKQRYDFKQLIGSCPDLSAFVVKNKYSEESIDFSDPNAVKTLNKALLKHFYKIVWDIPNGYLCPPIPGRADYIHHIADLLGALNKGVIPLGPSIRIFDIGTGANCIYPVIGYREYGWKFIGSDIDPIAINSAQKIVNLNELSDVIELRLQSSSSDIFKGVLESNEQIDLSICNPPFHASLEEALQGTERKWKNLKVNKSSTLNFGGKKNELSCLGGEIGFLRRMIKESVHAQEQCRFFSTLVSKEENLPLIHKELKDVKALAVKTINMAQGQKKSRIVAWSFLRND
ncbi:MAG: 23S rRNA (adenine(1618)-N(6))-methyltransferase RlmF [Chlamydiota bacterium]